ncbi:MAG: hypothetical protein AAGF54_05890 [Pseudomonadota bacterium]
MLNEVFSNERWQEFMLLHEASPELVRKRQRDKLDTKVPDELCIEVLSRHPGVIFRSNNILRSYRFTAQDQSFSFMSIFQEFGGSILEEVLEKGSKEI